MSHLSRLPHEMTVEGLMTLPSFVALFDTLLSLGSCHGLS